MQWLSGCLSAKQWQTATPLETDLLQFFSERLSLTDNDCAFFLSQKWINGNRLMQRSLLAAPSSISLKLWAGVLHTQCGIDAEARNHTGLGEGYSGHFFQTLGRSQNQEVYNTSSADSTNMGTIVILTPLAAGSTNREVGHGFDWLWPINPVASMSALGQ